MPSVISRRSPLARRVRALAVQPDPGGALLLDGVHLVRAAIDAGTPIETVAVSSSRLEAPTEEGDTARALARRGIPLVEVADAVFASLSPVRTPSGLLAVALRPPATPEAACAGPTPFVLGAIDVQDPGNLGALLRVAEAGGVTGVLVGAGSASPFSWKAARGSMGAVLRLPVTAALPHAELVAAMRARGLRLVASVPRDGDDPDAVDWTGGVGLLMGGEGRGLDPALAAACDARVTIPMVPPVESLNVATAAAVLVYAARRQRVARG